MNPDDSNYSNDKRSDVENGLLDTAVCQAKQIYGDLVECLMKQEVECHYTLIYGSGRFCQHPQRLDIAIRTENEKRGKQAEKDLD